MTRTSLSARLIARGSSGPRLNCRLVALIALVVLIAAGCNLQLEVEIDIEEDGSGTVTAGIGLDPDAQARFPSINELVISSDLVAADWTVTPPQVLSDGRQWVQASKDFANPTDLQAVLDELFGADNRVFTDFELQRDSSSTEKTFELTGTVDLTRGIELFSDEALQELLDVPPIGFDITEIEADLGGVSIEDAVQTRVVVRLPAGGDQQIFDVELGESQTITAAANSENRVAQLLGWVRTALLILFGVAVVLAILNFVIDRRYAKTKPARKPRSVAERVPQSADAAGPSPEEPSAPRSSMQLIVLDAHDVLFRMSADPGERLIPFIREQGGDATDAEIIEYHRQATLGRLHAAAFWQSVGVEGDPEDLEAHLLSGVAIQQGAREFLREMHRRGVPVAVVTNDMAEWSYRLRDLHGMSGVAPWIVSSDIGVRKPDPAAFEALRRVTGVPYHSMLIVDGQIPALDMAKTLGMTTAWFARQPPPDGTEPGHPVITKFGDFFRRRRAPEPSGGLRRRRG